MILFFACIQAGNPSVYAQCKAGIKAGMNAGQLSSYQGSSRLGIHGGLFVNISLGGKWRLQPEAIYSGEGQRYTVEESKRVIAIGYIQFPVLLQYQAAEKFYLECGPQLGILAHASSRGDDIAKLNVKRSFNNTQAGISVGGGVEVKEGMRFYGRYQLGLTDVTLGEIKDQSRVIMIGLSMQLKKK